MNFTEFKKMPTKFYFEIQYLIDWLIDLFIYLFIYWVWQPEAGLQRIHTDIHAVKELGLYISTFTQSSLQVTLEVRKWVRYERILVSVCTSANCWIFQRFNT